MATKPTGTSGGGLTEAQQQALANDFIADALDVTAHVPNPSAVLLGGQPGAGKSVVKGQIASSYDNKGGIVTIDPDEIRPALPYMDTFLAKGGSDIPEFANKDAGDIAYKVLQGLKGEQRNVLVDGTLRNTPRAQSMALDLKTTGFNVEFHGMAVYPDLSHARTYLRREQEIRRSSTGFGRAVDDDFHDTAVAGYTDTVKAFFDQKNVDRMVLYDRAGEVVTDVKLEAGAWKVTSTGAAVSAAKHPVNVLHKAHTQPDAATLLKTAETWSQATLLASTRTPVAPDVDQLAAYQAAAESKARAAVIQPAPSTTYRGPIVAVNGNDVLQAVGAELVSHRKATLFGPGKDTLATVGADVKITYGVHTDVGLIQSNGRSRSRSR